MTFESEKAKECAVCKGIVPSWTSGAMGSTTLHTPWGEFTVYYHKTCYHEEVVKREVTKLALAAKPKDEPIPPVEKEVNYDDSES